MIKYEDDFYGWSQEQAECLRSNVLSAIDTGHLAEEIEALGIRDEHAITRQLQRLLHHLLKWRYQPTHRTPSWRRSIRHARNAINDRMNRSPSLRTFPSQRLALAYRRARMDAVDDTGFSRTTFPPHCEWEIEDILRENFFPLSDEEEIEG